MVNENQKKLALDRVRENIARRGHHIYVVAGGPAPRFAYTIGLRGSVGTELLLAGAYFYSDDEVVDILNKIASQLNRHGEALTFEIQPYGSFTLGNVHATWAMILMLGALDFYQTDEISALQVVPDKAHLTTDVPNLTQPWNLATAPAWKWLHRPWTYSVDSKSRAVTSLGALRGERITEVARWEEDEWELFAGAGPDISKEELRVVPLGTLIAVDESLTSAVSLPIGEGLWRDSSSDSPWHPWQKKGHVESST